MTACNRGRLKPQLLLADEADRRSQLVRLAEASSRSIAFSDYKISISISRLWRASQKLRRRAILWFTERCSLEYPGCGLVSSIKRSLVVSENAFVGETYCTCFRFWKLNIHFSAKCVGRHTERSGYTCERFIEVSRSLICRTDGPVHLRCPRCRSRRSFSNKVLINHQSLNFSKTMPERDRMEKR